MIRSQKISDKEDLFEILKEFKKNPELKFLKLSSQGLSPDDIIYALEKVNAKLVASPHGVIARVQDTKMENSYSKNARAFDFHKDGFYEKSLPQYVLLFCEEPSIKGGETFIADAEPVCQALLKKYQRAREATVTLQKKGRLTKTRSFLEKNKDGFWNLNYLPISQYVIYDYSGSDIDDLLRFTQRQLVRNFIFKQRLKRGDLLIFNNQRLLHGRTSFKDGSTKRSLVRIWFFFDKKSR